MIPYDKSFRFQLISDTLSSENNLLTVSELCDYAAVSRSGFYYWKNSADSRDIREKQDRTDLELILQIYNHRRYKKGAREIYMALLHMDEPVVMNVKKIRRIMHKYGLKCPIRRTNPYRKMMKASHENRVSSNILERRFNDYGPRTVFLTDITYIPLHDRFDNMRFVYLSVIMDACTKEVLAHKLSKNLKEDFVLETVRQLLNEHKIDQTKICLIHSDQGVHYTSIQFRQLLKDNGIRQSMSRRGNCWDNAPQESFFGHMKDDLNDLLGRCRSVSQISDEIDSWMDYYNNERYQWGLCKLSPKEYYSFVTTGIYPLKIKTIPDIPKWKDPAELLENNIECTEQTTE